MKQQDYYIPNLGVSGSNPLGITNCISLFCFLACKCYGGNEHTFSFLQQVAGAVRFRSNHILSPLDITFSVWRAVLSAALVLTSSLPGAAVENAPPACLAAPGVEATIVRIVDSQTIQTATGKLIRLAAIEAPNSIMTTRGGKNMRLIRRARNLLARLTLNKKVNLVFDAGKPDRYGRRFAHILVFLSGKNASIWVQAAMVARGLARAFPNTRDATCIEPLLEIEKAARSKKTGVWKSRIYRVIKAENLKTLNRSLGQLQLIEGRVHSVAVRRTRIYINFSSDWKRDFTITLNPRIQRLFTQGGINIKELADKSIRVRGWLGRHNGPTIMVNHVAQIEMMKD